MRNGSRACAHYAYSNALADKSMKFLTDAGVIASSVEGNIVESQLTDVEKYQSLSVKMDVNGTFMIRAFLISSLL